jgi:hypothetical protein
MTDEWELRVTKSSSMKVIRGKMLAEKIVRGYSTVKRRIRARFFGIVATKKLALFYY